MDLDLNESGCFAGPVSYSKTSDVVDTWMFAGRYRPNEDLSVYARAGSGYRPGTANFGVIDPVTGENLAQREVRPDNVWSYELGAKGNAIGGIFSYDLALWYLDWNDFQTTVSINGRGTFVNAEGGISANGFEGTFSLNPVDNFSVTSSIAYTDSTLDKDEPSVYGLSGQQLPTLPKWTASMIARYEFPVMSGFDAHIGGGFRYKGSARTNFSDSESYDPYNPEAGGRVAGVNVPTDSYVVVDLNAGVVKDNISINFYVTNLFNNDTYSKINAYYLGENSLTVTGHQLRARTVGAVILFDF